MQQEMTPNHDIVMHTDVSADVSPDSHLVLVSYLKEATQESLSPHAAGPSCARMSDDQNEPFFYTDAKIFFKKSQIWKSLKKKKSWVKYKRCRGRSKSQDESIIKKSLSGLKHRSDFSRVWLPYLNLQANGHTNNNHKGACVLSLQ